MTKKTITNFGMSVKNKLLSISKESGIPYMTILVRYIQERLLYRIAQSYYRDNFFLKGGALLYAFNQEKSRPTKDIDFLGININNDQANIKAIFEQITTIKCEEDGIAFDPNSITTEDITQEKKYHGLRLTILATLDTIRQQISMDIGFGDIVTPGPQNLDYPLLLENVPSVKILAYSLETVIAEKFEAMISLSVNNSRMKDFFDVFCILNDGNLRVDILEEAIINTFRNRNTFYIEQHPLFSDDFFTDSVRVARWKGFLKGIKWQDDIPFAIVGRKIRKALSPYWHKIKLLS
ncbi:MAG: nucleotidyl transferase AbiEii/AbiGii toxin family protein [Bacteroidales bacterium]|nr:nucleotidyl transferase AbiEii/AbiGii toxin family protein [Bacteroidales bacterium]